MGKPSGPRKGRRVQIIAFLCYMILLWQTWHQNFFKSHQGLRYLASTPVSKQLVIPKISKHIGINLFLCAVPSPKRQQKDRGKHRVPFFENSNPKRQKNPSRSKNHGGNKHRVFFFRNLHVKISRQFTTPPFGVTLAEFINCPQNISTSAKWPVWKSQHSKVADHCWPPSLTESKAVIFGMK